MASPLFPLTLAFGLLIVIAGALEAGYRVGRRRPRTDAQHERSNMGTIQGATLGLLGLLLGFSFAGAASRFVERQNLVTQEANAIGTAYLRAELLPAPARDEVRKSLREYAGSRLAWSEARGSAERATRDREAERAHRQIWASAAPAVAAAPGLAMPVLGPINEVIDLHTVRMAALTKHLPLLVLGSLTVSALCTLAMVGFGCGLSGKRSLLLTGPFAFLVWMALWLTIDLDYPRRGLIRFDQPAMRALVESLGE